MRNLDTDTATTQIKRLVDPVAEVAIIGSRLCFSDTALRLAEAELGDIQTTRYANFEDYRRAYLKYRGGPYVLIIGQELAPELLVMLRNHPALFQDAAVALAYHTEGPALNVLGRNDASVHPVSFLSMNGSMDVWLLVLRLLLKGGSHVPTDLIVALDAKRAAATRDGEDQGQNAARLESILTGRQIEVLGMVASGMQNKHIADKLGLSENTIKLHMHHIISRLGVNNRTQAASHFHQHGGAFRHPPTSRG